MEKKKDNRGGRRPGAGRKRKPVDWIERHLYAEELQIRRDLEALFKNERALKAPDYLDDIAYAKWNEIMLAYSQLEINVLNILDTTQLVLYCQSWSRYMHAYNEWKDICKMHVAVLKDESQKAIKTLLKVMDDETSNMARLASDLLLTPVGRVKYGANGAESKKRDDEEAGDSFDRFLERRGKR